MSNYGNYSPSFYTLLQPGGSGGGSVKTGGKGKAGKSIRVGRAAARFGRAVARNPHVRTTAKVRFFKSGSGSAKSIIHYTNYIQERERGPFEKERQFYDRDNNKVDRDVVVKELLSARGDRVAMFDLILSPGDNTIFFPDYVKDVMTGLEDYLGAELNWHWVPHHNTNYFHAHVELSATDKEGNQIRLDRDALALLREVGDRHVDRHRGIDREYNQQIEREFLAHEKVLDRMAKELRAWDRCSEERYLAESYLLGTDHPFRDREIAKVMGLGKRYDEPVKSGDVDSNLKPLHSKDKPREEQIEKKEDKERVADDKTKEVEKEDKEPVADDKTKEVEKEDKEPVADDKTKEGEKEDKEPVADDKTKEVEQWDKEKAIAELPADQKIDVLDKIYTKFSPVDDLKKLDHYLNEYLNEHYTPLIDKQQYKQMWSWIGTKERYGDDHYERQAKEQWQDRDRNNGIKIDRVQIRFGTPKEQQYMQGLLEIAVARDSDKDRALGHIDYMHNHYKTELERSALGDDKSTENKAREELCDKYLAGHYDRVSDFWRDVAVVYPSLKDAADVRTENAREMASEHRERIYDRAGEREDSMVTTEKEPRKEEFERENSERESYRDPFEKSVENWVSREDRGKEDKEPVADDKTKEGEKEDKEPDRNLDEFLNGTDRVDDKGDSVDKEKVDPFIEKLIEQVFVGIQDKDPYDDLRENVEVDQTDITEEADTSDIDEWFEDSESVDVSPVDTEQVENVPDEREDINRDDEIWRLDGAEDR